MGARCETRQVLLDSRADTILPICLQRGVYIHVVLGIWIRHVKTMADRRRIMVHMIYQYLPTVQTGTSGLQLPSNTGIRIKQTINGAPDPAVLLLIADSKPGSPWTAISNPYFKDLAPHLQYTMGT